jgi:hypothetical protein
VKKSNETEGMDRAIGRAREVLGLVLMAIAVINRI